MPFTVFVVAVSCPSSSWRLACQCCEWLCVCVFPSVRVHSDASDFAGEVTAASQGSVLGCDDTDIPKPRVPKITSDSFISALVSDRSAPAHDPPSAAHPNVPEDNQVTSQESNSSILSPSSPSDGSKTPWSNVDLEEMKGSVPSSARSSVATYPIELQHNTVVQEELPPWAWVTGGGCDIDSSSHVDLFNISGATQLKRSSLTHPHPQPNVVLSITEGTYLKPLCVMYYKWHS